MGLSLSLTGQPAVPLSSIGNTYATESPCAKPAVRRRAEGIRIVSKREMIASERGYYGVVCYMPKHETNVGTLWRSAFLYNASFIGTVGRRYEKQPSDTPNTPLRVPLHHFSDIDDLKAHLPYSCPLIGVELAEHAVPLNKFWHPTNAIYLLGAEDYGLPPSVLAKCHKVIQIPSPKEWSMNVAVAGSIIIWDRYNQGLK